MTRKFDNHWYEGNDCRLFYPWWANNSYAESQSEVSSMQTNEFLNLEAVWLFPILWSVKEQGDNFKK